MNSSSKRALAVVAILVGLMAGVDLLSRDSAAPTTGGPSLTASPRVATSQSTRSPAATAATAIPAATSTASPAATLGGERIGAWPALGAPARNGLIAYSDAGDIFVGDTVSGTSSAIVTGPSNDTRPIFSPDGLRIAFLRAGSEQDATIVVVRADGSDERVVMAEGFTDWIPGFAWTPDSSSILLNHDLDGQLSLVDASGVAEPRLITPPLLAQRGYTYFSIHDPVAPMFRPPNGDQIVGVVDGEIFVVNFDGTRIEGFVSPSLTEFREAGADLASVPDQVDRLAWSRDGSLISFRHESDLFVMNADGSDLRRFETEFLDRAWSPDGSKIALEKPTTVAGSAGSVIAILDVETGAERVLEATSAVEKDIADRATDPDAFRTYSIRTEHRYAYEGWSWTPDGRSIVVLERHGTRPFFVDIETGQVTELPWVVDGGPIVAASPQQMTRTSRQLALAAGLTSALVGCALWSPPVPVSCGWPPGTRLAFAGEASLAELGVGGSARSDIPWQNPRGMVYVTAEAIRVASHLPPERRYCVVYSPPLANGSGGGSGPVRDDWEPPPQ